MGTYVRNTRTIELHRTPIAIASPLVDFDQLQSACDGDASLMRELMDLYFGQADEIMAGLEKALQAGDVPDVDHLAHKLAGSSLACGMSAIVPAACEKWSMAPRRAIWRAPRICSPKPNARLNYCGRTVQNIVPA